MQPPEIRWKERSAISEKDVFCTICQAVHHGPLSTKAEILHTIAQIERYRSKASTTTIAAKVHLSVSQTRRYLQQLEEEGWVQRVGQRAGWKRIA